MIKYICFGTRSVLTLILFAHNIPIYYAPTNSANQYVVNLSIITGSAIDFISTWFSIVAKIITPPTLLSLLATRSCVQQFIHINDSIKFRRNASKMLEDKCFQEEFTKFLETIQNQNNNPNAIKLDNLNWNKNPEIREATKRLGIFENQPSALGKINLDMDDPVIKEMAEEFGLFKKSKINSKKLFKAKPIYFRDFVNDVLDSDSESNLDSINVKIMEDPLRIKIKN